jgi:YHS domain-containing protein
MTMYLRILASLSFASVLAVVTGCADKPAEAPTTEETVTVEEVEEVEVPPVTTTPAPTDGAATDTVSPEIIAASEITAAMAELDEADRTAALAQKICPVSDEPLGSMGTPLKIDVAGRTVFICCEGCRDSLLKEPEKFLAKLDTPAAK